MTDADAFELVSAGPVDTEFFAANNPGGSAIRQSKVDRLPRQPGERQLPAGS